MRLGRQGREQLVDALGDGGPRGELLLEARELRLVRQLAGRDAVLAVKEDW